MTAKLALKPAEPRKDIRTDDPLGPDVGKPGLGGPKLDSDGTSTYDTPAVPENVQQFIASSAPPTPTLWTANPSKLEPPVATGGTFLASTFTSTLVESATQFMTASASPPDVVVKIDRLEADHIVDAETANELRAYLADPVLADVVVHGIKTSHGKLEATDKKGNPTPDPVMAITAIEGALFQARMIRKGEAMGGRWGASPAEFTWKEPAAPPKTKLIDKMIDNDVPIFPERILEVKRYPRKEYSPELNGKQLLNYQKAIGGGIPDSPYKNASVVITGNVNPEIISWMKTNAPDVELLYSIRLPSGQDYVFSLKAPSEGHASLLEKFPQPTNLTPREEAIVRGIRKSLVASSENGNAARPIDGILRSSLLGTDPVEIKEPATLREFEKNILEERWNRFEALGTE